ncbi:MAG: hypothetical protein EXQ55_04665 [Acidobacteria bacterium]|nr:hypothetical protein [Acidobacteriota bacterium]
MLTNASAFYPAMLDAIRGAKQSVNMECYIFLPDDTGRRFMDAMIERARAGVIVTVTVDAIGSLRFGQGASRGMRQEGCRVELYQRFKWYRLARVNNRTHRELLIVDGVVAFVGGAGVGDQWTTGMHGKQPWRDTMVRVTGPVAASIQGVFAENWVECCGEILSGPKFFRIWKKLASPRRSSSGVPPPTARPTRGSPFRCSSNAQPGASASTRRAFSRTGRYGRPSGRAPGEA